MTPGDPASVSDLLEEMAELSSLAGENPFKVKAFEKAADVLRGRDDLTDRARAGTLTEIAGVGKGIAAVLEGFLLKGDTAERDQLRAELPAGLWDVSRLPGLGPKKARQVVEELGITSIGELEYACRENRLSLLKGFGEKAQAKVLAAIEFQKTIRGWSRIDEALAVSGVVQKILGDGLGLRVEESGALRRRAEVLDRLEFLAEVPAGKSLESLRERSESLLSLVREKSPLAVVIEFAESERFGSEWVFRTSSAEHRAALGAEPEQPHADESSFYRALGLEWIAPELREDAASIELARAKKLASVVNAAQLRGVFHMHTTASDGAASLPEMMEAARARGYSYVGITDHSQSAFYAQGLKPPALKEQEKEVRALEEKNPGMRLFWGIESDILADGSLDYDEKTLKRFDFVIASIHSRFQMGREAMTERILTAIRNPATRMIGHLTGRLLLGRAGYDCDVEGIVREAARCDVAIEINAHPARLDIDWRWGRVMRESGVKVAINPDAHEVAGFDDTAYGVIVARKALLPTEQIINTWPTERVEAWLSRGQPGK